MNTDKIISQFLCFRNEQNLEENIAIGKVFKHFAATAHQPFSGSVMFSTLLGDQAAQSLAERIAYFGTTESLSSLSFKVYDNWKHQRNEITHLGAESHYHQYGLKQSNLGQYEFECYMLQVIISVAHLGGHLDIKEFQNLLPEKISKLTQGEEIKYFEDYLGYEKILHEAVIHKLSLETKVEYYIATCLLLDSYNMSESVFLKQFSNQLKLPIAIINQVKFHIPRYIPQAA